MSVGTTPAPATARAEDALLELVTRGLLVQAISVAARLGIADLLEEGPKRADELAEAVGADQTALYRLLRTLAGLGLFVEDGEGRFAPTPLGRALRRGDGSAHAAAVYFGEPFVWKAWGNLLHSVLTGEPAFRRAHGTSIFDYLSAHPEAEQAFHAWMTARSQLQVAAVLDAYDFSRFRTVVDVGGGHGSLLAAILDAEPSLRGVLFDLPAVVARAPALGDRCDVVGGDFFDAVPPGADCYLLKFVVHDWDDERAARILRNVRSAIADGGTILLLEYVVPPGSDYHHAKFMDLHVLVLTEGGRERTEDEYRRLLRDAGFQLRRVVPTAAPLAIVEGAPRA